MAKPDEENSFSTTTHNQSDQTALQPQTSQKHRLFKDFSMVQVIASALSADYVNASFSTSGIIGGVVQCSGRRCCSSHCNANIQGAAQRLGR